MALMIFFFGHIFTSALWAGTPHVELVDDGSVRVSCFVDAAMPTVKGAIADPLLMMDFSEGLKIEQKGLMGDCRIIEYQTGWSNYKVKMCPVDSGFNFDLLSSATLAAFWTRWRFKRESGGTQIDYQIMVQPKIPLPKRIMQERLKRDVEIFFRDFQRYFE